MGASGRATRTKDAVFKLHREPITFIRELKSERFKKGREQKHPAQMENAVSRNHKGLDKKIPVWDELLARAPPDDPKTRTANVIALGQNKKARPRGWG